MKSKNLLPLIFLFFLMLSCCSNEVSNKKIVTRINDYELTFDEFQNQLALELELDEDFKLTHATRKQFLEEIIQKELLIQEAKRAKLDQQKKFVQAIERYWESTLIRNLIDLKSEEIDKKVVVSEEEIKLHYDKMKKQTPSLPDFQKFHNQIEKKVKEEKRIRLLKEWMDNLRKNAGVEIFPSMLE
ncbi:MAG: hypothetical protein EHJ94_01145 [Deltaproteobacteria bacterium]|nr:MAG: hypothetical protein EHJ94_01145 [Deltaproteobacteria bacterium]